MRLDAVFPPMATVFDRRGDVDGAAISANVAKWIAAGVGGVVALGSNGEAPFLDDDEGDHVVAAARRSVPRDRALIVGTGRESTRATIAASRRAAALGADAVLVRTPSFYKARMTPDVFVRHYTAVADAARRARAPLQRAGRDRRQPDSGCRRPSGRASQHHRREGNRERHGADRGLHRSGRRARTALR